MNIYFLLMTRAGEVVLLGSPLQVVIQAYRLFMEGWRRVGGGCHFRIFLFQGTKRVTWEMLVLQVGYIPLPHH